MVAGKERGSWKHSFLTLYLPRPEHAHVSLLQLLFCAPFVGSYSTAPWTLCSSGVHVRVTDWQGLAWCSQMGAEPGSGPLNIVV